MDPGPLTPPQRSKNSFWCFVRKIFVIFGILLPPKNCPRPFLAVFLVAIFFWTPGTGTKNRSPSPHRCPNPGQPPPLLVQPEHSSRPPFPELESDPIIASHLTELYDSMLEQHLLRVIEPYSEARAGRDSRKPNEWWEGSRSGFFLTPPPPGPSAVGRQGGGLGWVVSPAPKATGVRNEMGQPKTGP